MGSTCERLVADITLPSIVLLPPHGQELLNVVRVEPSDVFGEGLFAGVELVAEGALVVLLLEWGVTGVLLLVYSEVRLGGVTLQTHVTLEGLLSCVYPGVTLILPCAVKGLVTLGALERLLAYALDDDRSQSLWVHCSIVRTIGSLTIYLHLIDCLVFCCLHL